MILWWRSDLLQAGGRGSRWRISELGSTRLVVQAGSVKISLPGHGRTHLRALTPWLAAIIKLAGCHGSPSTQHASAVPSRSSHAPGPNPPFLYRSHFPLGRPLAGLDHATALVVLGTWETHREREEATRETKEPRTRIFPAAGRSADAFRAPLARQVCRLACAASFRATRKRQRRIATAASCLAFCHSPAAEASGREHVAFGVPTSFFLGFPFPSPAGDDASEADSVRLPFPPGVRPVSYPHKAGALR